MTSIIHFRTIWYWLKHCSPCTPAVSQTWELQKTRDPCFEAPPDSMWTLWRKKKITLKVKVTWFTVFIYVSSLWLKFFSSVLTTERSNSRSNWNWIYFSAFEEVRTTKQRVTPELWCFVPEEDLIQNHNDICNNTKIARNPASEHTVTQQYFKQFTPFV